MGQVGICSHDFPAVFALLHKFPSRTLPQHVLRKCRHLNDDFAKGAVGEHDTVSPVVLHQPFVRKRLITLVAKDTDSLLAGRRSW